MLAFTCLQFSVFEIYFYIYYLQKKKLVYVSLFYNTSDIFETSRFNIFIQFFFPYCLLIFFPKTVLYSELYKDTQSQVNISLKLFGGQLKCFKLPILIIQKKYIWFFFEHKCPTKYRRLQSSFVTLSQIAAGRLWEFI